MSAPRGDKREFDNEFAVSSLKFNKSIKQRKCKPSIRITHDVMHANFRSTFILILSY